MTTGNREELRIKPFQLTGLFFLGVLFSAILGGLTTAINATVSPISILLTSCAGLRRRMSSGWESHREFSRDCCLGFSSP